MILALCLLLQNDAETLKRIVRSDRFEFDVRFDAMRQLADHPIDRTADLYRELIRDADSPFAAEAMRRLGPLGDSRARAWMLEPLADELKLAAVDVLRGDVQSLLMTRPRPTGALRAAIVAALDDRDAVFEATRRGPGAIGRELAVEAAAKFDDAYDVLVAALADVSEDVRAAAAASLTDPRAADALARSNECAAIDALARLAPERVVEKARHESRTVRLWALTAECALPIEVLQDALGSDDWRERSAAIRAMARRRQKDCIAPLIERVDRESGRLQADAIAALRDLTGQTFGVRGWREWWSKYWKAFELPKPDVSTRVVSGGFFSIPVESRRVIFCADISKSMRGRPLEAAQAELDRVLGELAPEARFNLIFFNNLVRPWKERLQPATASAVAASREHVAALSARNSTRFEDALMLALDDPDADTIFVLSDGKVDDPDALLTAIRRRNRQRQMAIHTVAVEPSGFLKKLAAQNGGRHAELPR